MAQPARSRLQILTSYGQKTHSGRCHEQELIALRTLVINQAGRSRKVTVGTVKKSMAAVCAR
jgi:hypothetical protein